MKATKGKFKFEKHNNKNPRSTISIFQDQSATDLKVVNLAIFWR